MNIDNIKKVCIVGWGKSGYSLCNLILALKKYAKVTERKERNKFHFAAIDKLQGQGVDFEFGGHSEKFIKDSQLVVLSPGVDPLNSPVVKIANNLNVPCVGEVEFASWLTKAKFVAITGTNGKTTTTFLTYRVLKENKKRVFLGGNIGIPVSSFILDTKKNDFVVLEISSFQLETIIGFRPFVATLLNIEPNHLDRHPTFGDYFEAKMNIFRNQQKDDWAVLNKNIEGLNAIEKRIKSRIVHFSSEFDNENLSCVYKIASIFSIDKAECLKVFSSFKGIPHRLQVVRAIGDVTFVNDSKSTNPSSAIWAFRNIKGPIILIAGGKDKGVDYVSVVPYLKNVKKINLFGQAAGKIEAALKTHADIKVFSSLKEVVDASFKDADKRATVLFSPMCSSFDMFTNYMERGRKFIEAVNSIEK
ncbi:MAG: UDP-N-acetylmuramoyl-L-alanine--D-glutamate ligase [Candidatus Omnitrophota bacterium]|jgi:UDP-N-acetylmuramoylalanine--D-glutamate ligase